MKTGFPLLLSVCLTVGVMHPSHADTYVKANNTSNLNLAVSWTNGAVPGSGDVALWTTNVTAANATVLGADLAWLGIVMTNPGGNVTINAGNTLTLGSSGIVNLSGVNRTLTLKCGLNLATGQVWTTSQKLTVDATSTGITGTGPLTKSGAGLLDIEAAGGKNTFSGDLIVSNGTVQLGTSDSNILPDGPGKGNLVIVSPGTVDYREAADTINGLAGDGTITDGGGATRGLTLGNHDASSTFSGAIGQMALNLTKIGAGTFTLGGTNLSMGSTIVSNGVLQMGSPKTFGYDGRSTFAIGEAATPVTVCPGATLDVNAQTGGVARTIMLNGGALVNNSATPARLSAFFGVHCTNGGTGIVAPATVSITGGGGTGAGATVSLGLEMASFTLTNGGTGYTKNSVLTVSGGGGTGGKINVDGTNAVDGAITAWSVVPGSGFTGIATGITRTASTGSGAGFIIHNSYTVVAVTTTNAGGGYTSPPTVSLPSGSDIGWVVGPVVSLGANSFMGGSGDLTVHPPLSGGYGLAKIGSGTLVLGGTNTYTGATTVSNGTLAVNGSLAVASAVTVTNAVLAGTGTLNGTVAVWNGGALSPAGSNAIGTLTTGSNTWNAGGRYTFELADANGAPGAGYDTLAIAGALNVQAASNTPFTISLVSLSGSSPGPAANFNSASNYAWTLANAGTSIMNADAGSVVLNTDGFQNALNGGTFSVTIYGNLLQVVFRAFGQPAQVRVETAPDGTGTVVPVTDLGAGNSMTVYAVTRDALGNYVANEPAAAWTLQNVTGDIAVGDLAANGSNAVFTARRTGTAQIRAVLPGLASVDSGTITVTAGAATHIKVETKSDGTGVTLPATNLVVNRTLTAYAIARDTYESFVSNAAVTAWMLIGRTDGVVTNDLVPSGNMKSAVFTAHVPGTAVIRADTAGLGSADSGIITVTPWAGTTNAALALQPFDYRGVALTGGRMKAQFDLVTNEYMSIPNDNLLKGFRTRAGLPAPGTNMGGWYSSDTFHIFGQILSGLSRVVAATGDPACKAKVQYLVDEWAKCIATNGYFYYSASTAHKSYTYDKTVCGLVDAYHYAGATNTLESLTNITRYAESTLDRSNTNFYGNKISGGVPAAGWEWYTLSENLYRAYLYTGDLRYRDFGDVWRYTDYWNAYASTQSIWTVLSSKGSDWYHAYSHLNTLSGAGMSYLLYGRPADLATIRNAYDYFIRNQVWATGGFGPSENLLSSVWTNSGYAQTALDGFFDSHFETQCGSWAIFKLCKALIAFTGEAHYGDWIEKAVMNGIGASVPMASNGEVQYYSHYHLNGAKKTTNQGPWTCCAGTRSQAVPDYHDLIYFHNAAGDLYVNLFNPSTVTWDCRGTNQTLVQTAFTNLQGASFTLTLTQPAAFTLAVRVPPWLASPMTAAINGAPAGIVTNAQGWALFNRLWQSGDRLDVALPMRFALDPFPEGGANAYPAAVSYGPFVMAFKNTGTNPVAMINTNKLASNFVPVTGQPLTFTLAADPTVIVKPYADFALNEKYFMYFAPPYAWVGVDHSELTYTGTWNNNTSLDLHTATSDATPPVAQYTFNGTAARFRFKYYADAGIAGVSVDGGPQSQVNEYSTWEGLAGQYAITNLPPGTHTLRISPVSGKIYVKGIDYVTPTRGPYVPPSGSVIMFHLH